MPANTIWAMPAIGRPPMQLLSSCWHFGSPWHRVSALIPAPNIPLSPQTTESCAGLKKILTMRFWVPWNSTLASPMPQHQSEDRRFQPPEAPGSWQEVRNATQFAPVLPTERAWCFTWDHAACVVYRQLGRGRHLHSESERRLSLPQCLCTHRGWWVSDTTQQSIMVISNRGVECNSAHPHFQQPWFRKYFPIGILKKSRSYKPWTKPTSYEVNHNIDNLYLKQKIQYLKIRQKDKRKGTAVPKRHCKQNNLKKKRWVSIELLMLIMDIETIYFMFIA